MNSRRARFCVHLTAALLLALAVPAIPASAAPIAVPTSPVQANTDPNAIVRQIDAALKDDDYTAADRGLDALEELAQRAQETVQRSPTKENQDAANKLRKLTASQVHRVSEAKLSYGLKQRKYDPNARRHQDDQVQQKYWEAVVASWVGPLLVQFDRKYNRPGSNNRQIDVEVQRAFIEVTIGNGDDKLKQATAISGNPVVNPQNKKIIIFGPYIKNRQRLEDLEKAGFKVVRTKPELFDALRKLGEPVDSLPPAKQTAEQRQLAAKAAAQSAENLGLGSDCPKPVGEGGRSGDRPVLAMAAALPMAAPCGESALAKALASNDLGGVDFTTLGMRYMSDNPGSGGLRYSFSASPGLVQNPQAGLDALTNSTADLRTWLVLDPNKFWVNLNPTEPDRIIDPALGQTNAGKALLEADFQMKNTEGKLINPHTKFGARYWNELEGSSKSLCYSSRMWIAPGDVQVREDGGSLYILKAQLAVKAVAEHVGGVSRSCHYDPEVDARGERLEQRTVVPKIAAAVNTAPEYAPIRRAFLARIVAQWIRNRHQSGHRTSFDHLIDSGNIGPARLQGDWRPRQVFDAYVHSIRDGKFTYKTTTHRGLTTIIETRTFGGVDFSKLNSTPISAAQMGQQYPQLPQTVKASTNRPATASDGSIWLGETAPTPGNGLWSRTTGTITNFVAGRTGVLIVVLVALGVVTFGIRGGTRRKRRTS
jgi:hypothetical protein